MLSHPLSGEPAPGVLTAEEIELFRASRTLREKANQLIRLSQLATRAAGAKLPVLNRGPVTDPTQPPEPEPAVEGLSVTAEG